MAITLAARASCDTPNCKSVNCDVVMRVHHATNNSSAIEVDDGAPGWVFDGVRAWCPTCVRAINKRIARRAKKSKQNAE
jgi:hypothetical protein